MIFIPKVRVKVVSVNVTMVFKMKFVVVQDWFSIQPPIDVIGQPMLMAVDKIIRD